jgi:hypothetical protein
MLRSGLAVCVTTIVLLIGLGCRTAQEEDVYGKYVVKYRYGMEKLVLRSDRTYTQEVQIDGQTGLAIQEGSWVYRAGKGLLDPARVDLDHCLVVDDGFGRLKPGYKNPFPGICGLPVARKFFVGDIYFDRGTSYPLSRQDE